jgi:HEAT repeat protein
MTRRHWLLIALLTFVTLATPARPADSETITADLATLKAANLDTDTKALVAMIKKRTVSEEMRTKVAGLIKLLGAEEFDDREKASNDLIEIGAVARPQLIAALRDPDLETKKRARKALDKIGPASADASVLPAVARVLAERKPADVAELMLNFLPSIEEPDTAVEVINALTPIAKDKDGKADPAMVKALTDKKYPLKRWAAGVALARAGVKAQRESVLKLLDDEELAVRYRVATEVIKVRDKDNKADAVLVKGGMPAVLKLLETDNSEAFEAVEDLLDDVREAAGEKGKAPVQPEDLDAPKARTKYREAWEAWWKKEGEKFDMSKVDFQGVNRNYTLVGLYGYRNKQLGIVSEMDKDGKEKWKLEDLSYPVYACKTRRDRVLVCEYNANKVTERDVKNKVLWTKQLNTQPVYCERLPNGHTFIVARNELMEVDREGKSVRSITRNGYDIVTAGRHKDGTYSMVLNNGTVVRLDKTFKETSTYNTGRYVSYTVGLKCAYLGNGGLVMPDYSYRKIREFDKSGKLVAELDANYPTSVSKLSNGNYVYLSRLGNAGIVEIDKGGKQISNKGIPGNNNNVRLTPLFMERK